MLDCAICGGPLSAHHPCSRAHEDVCHACAALNLTGGSDARPHPAPRETPTLALTPRESQAVQAYQRRVLALVDPQALARLLTEEDAHVPT